MFFPHLFLLSFGFFFFHLSLSAEISLFLPRVLNGYFFNAFFFFVWVFPLSLLPSPPPTPLSFPGPKNNNNKNISDGIYEEFFPLVVLSASAVPSRQSRVQARVERYPAHFEVCDHPVQEITEVLAVGVLVYPSPPHTRNAHMIGCE